MVRPRNVNKKKARRDAPNWEEEDVFASRTQIKLAAEAVNELGEQLAGMSEATLARFQLSDEVAEAVAQLRRLDKGPAYKRQRSYVGKLLRQDEAQLAHIRETLAQLEREAREEKRLTDRWARWRDRLIEEGDDALADLLAEFPRADRNQLRQLIRQAQPQQPEQKRRQAARKLFQVIRDLHRQPE